MRSNLVHYCPGSASGSPAWMSRAQADSEMVRDNQVLQKLQGVDAVQQPICWPHIGGTCSRCQRQPQPNEQFQDMGDDVYLGKDGRYHLFLLWVRHEPNRFTHHSFGNMEAAKSFLRGVSVAHKMFIGDGQKIDCVSPAFYDMHAGPMELDMVHDNNGQLVSL